MIRVLQLGADKKFSKEVENYCTRLPDFRYQGESRGEALSQALDDHFPNLILLDMDLEPQGGLTALTEIRAKWSSDKVKVLLLSTRTSDEDVLRQAADLGADYFMQRPVDLVILEQRIRQLVMGSVLPPKELTLRNVQEICTVYFERMGIPPHYKGYRYLIEGIWLVALHPSWLHSVTQNLYPAIGHRFGVNGAQVERAMRYALDITWEKGNIDQLYQIFPHVNENKGKPTNSIFIAKMVDLVGLEVTLRG